MITDDNVESNCSMIENIPPKGVSFSDFICIFAMPDGTLVEVEFSSIDEANSFNPPEWFGKDVTHDGRFHNSYLSQIDCCLGK